MFFFSGRDVRVLSEPVGDAAVVSDIAGGEDSSSTENFSPMLIIPSSKMSSISQPLASILFSLFAVAACATYLVSFVWHSSQNLTPKNSTMTSTKHSIFSSNNLYGLYPDRQSR